MSMRVISQREIRQLLPMSDAIALMRRAFVCYAEGACVFPLRPVMKLPSERGVLAMMPGYVSDPEMVAIKVITVFPGNLGTPYDAHQGAVLLFDPTDGRLRALLDASELTAIRTAAATAVATEALSRTDAGDLAILGSGIQAQTHLEAMACVRTIRRIRIWSRTAEHAHAFVERESPRAPVQMEIVNTVREAVEGADLVCTTTAARTPILSGSWLHPGAHVNAVGSATPSMRELDTDAVVRAELFVDSRESATHEAGDFLIPRTEGVIDDSHIRAEVGEVLVGRAPGRSSDTALTLFKSLGIAVQDAVAAEHVFRMALTAGAGTEVDLGGMREGSGA